MQKELRKEKEKEFKQNLITDAARKLFIEKGFDETTMDDIAREAGFAKGTVYLYFKSKNELMAFIVLASYDSFFDEIEAMAAREIPAQEKMEKMTLMYREFVETTIRQYGFGNMWNNIEHMTDILTGETKANICRQNKRIFALVQQIIKEGQEQGVFNKDIDSLYTSIAISAFTSGLDQAIFLQSDLLQELEIDINKLLDISMSLIAKCLK